MIYRLILGCWTWKGGRTEETKEEKQRNCVPTLCIQGTGAKLLDTWNFGAIVRFALARYYSRPTSALRIPLVGRDPSD
jgi:hypothetical protein